MNNFVWMTAKKAYLSSEMNALIRIHLLLIYKYSFFTRNPEIFRRKNIRDEMTSGTSETEKWIFSAIGLHIEVISSFCFLI